MAYKYTPEQIKQAYNKMPRDLKDVYFAEDTGEVLQKIAKNNNLTVQQTGDLADETGLVMLGLTQTKEYISNLTERLAISKERAQKIAHDINDQIFSRVREELKEVHGLKPPTPKPFVSPPKKEDIPVPNDKISPMIQPQSTLADRETSLEDLANEQGGTALPQGQDLAQVAQVLEKNPEMYKAETAQVEELGKPAFAEATAGKNIFSEKIEEAGFRSAPETVEKTIEPKIPEKKEWKNPHYGEKKDPYRADPLEVE